MIPVLHLNRTKEKNAAETLKRAFTEYGFLVVAGHGIDQDLISAAYEESKEFFSQSQAIKDKSKGDGQHGYTSVGVEKAKDSDTPDLKEFFHIIANFDQLDHSSLYEKHNRTKELAFSSCKKLYIQLYDLSYNLLKLCSLSLNDPSPTVLANSITSGPSVLRLLHYPPISSPGTAVRAGAHEDINLITLLINATDAGLQVKHKIEGWIPVEAKPGEIIVNVGDMLQNYTNGYFKSTTHQVVNVDNGKSRYSMPFFAHPRPDFSLKPREFMRDRTGEPKYPRISAGEYLDRRLKEIGLK